MLSNPSHWKGWCEDMVTLPQEVFSGPQGKPVAGWWRLWILFSILGISILGTNFTHRWREASRQPVSWMGNACVPFVRWAWMFYSTWYSLPPSQLFRVALWLRIQQPLRKKKVYFFHLSEAKISKLVTVLKLCFQSHKFLEPKPPKWGCPCLCHMTLDVLVWPFSV